MNIVRAARRLEDDACRGTHVSHIFGPDANWRLRKMIEHKVGKTTWILFNNRDAIAYDLADWFQTDALSPVTDDPYLQMTRDGGDSL